MKAIDRFYKYLAEKSLKPTAIEKEIGLSNGYLSAQKKRNADMGEGMMLKIIDYFRDINPEWLLIGNGPMLRADDTPTTLSLSTTDTTSTSDTVVLRLMDKLDKKDAQIEHLQSELSTVKEELAALKAKHDATLSHSEVLGRAKAASTRKYSSVPYQPATSAHALSEPDFEEVK